MYMFNVYIINTLGSNILIFITSAITDQVMNPPNKFSDSQQSIAQVYRV